MVNEFPAFVVLAIFFVLIYYLFTGHGKKTSRESENQVVSVGETVEPDVAGGKSPKRKKKHKGPMGHLMSRRLMLFVRVAERVDRAFPGWLINGFTAEGEYKQFDNNMPSTIIQRPEGRSGFNDDTTLTELGSQQSRELGRSLVSLGLWPFDAIYVSPSLRSIQSASMIIKGASGSLKLRVEPTLLDYMGWYEKIPSFLSNDWLTKAGYPIDLDYKPLKTVDQVQQNIRQESLSMFYHRIAEACAKITQEGSESSGSPQHILFVMHATCMDAAIKALKSSSGKRVGEADFLHMGSYYPYLSTLMLAQDEGKWSYVHEPIPPQPYRGITNRVNMRFIERTTVPRNEKAPAK